MTITYEKNERNIIAIINGRLDTLSAAEFEKEQDTILAYATKQIIIDCEHLEYVSSTGLRVLLGLLKKVQAEGGELILKNMNDELKNIFKITRFDQLFNIQ